MVNEHKAFKATVRGRVQGVGFRYSTQAQAVRFGLTGYVRNMMDGSVEVVAEGESDRLERLINWLKKGPPGSYVSQFEFNYITYSGCYKSFQIEFY